MRTKALLTAALLAALAGLGLLGPPEAAAGGMDWSYPLRDRYEAGETATVIGYTVRATETDPDVLDWSDTGPFDGYLRVDPVAAERDTPDRWWPSVHPTDIPLGQPEVTGIGHDGYPEFQRVRVSLTFTIPADLAPGHYEVFVCNQGCTTTLGYLGGGEIHVGVDPARDVVRSWPLTEPAIAYLADDALVADPDSGLNLTAAQIRAGDVPPPTTLAPPPPSTTVTSDRAADDVVSAAPGSGADQGSDLGGTAPWLVALGLLVGLWCAGWKLGPRPDRPPRKRVTPTSRPGEDEEAALRSDHQVHVRL